jgi:hypothetical protein
MWQRRGTAAEWSNANPILAAGEIGVQLPPNGSGEPAKMKIGDGVTPWNTLPFGGSIDMSAITAAINALKAELDPFPQYTTPTEAAAAAPVQSVNGMVGNVVIAIPPAGVGEILVADGVSPPVMVTDELETDFLYAG